MASPLTWEEIDNLPLSTIFIFKYDKDEQSLLLLQVGQIHDNINKASLDEEELEDYLKMIQKDENLRDFLGKVYDKADLYIVKGNDAFSQFTLRPHKVNTKDKDNYDHTKAANSKAGGWQHSTDDHDFATFLRPSLGGNLTKEDLKTTYNLG